MQLLSRREYNLILRALDKYELYMNQKEKELSETLQDKLYYNLYNPKDGIARTEAELPDLSILMIRPVISSFYERLYSLSCSNCSHIAEGYAAQIINLFHPIN